MDSKHENEIRDTGSLKYLYPEAKEDGLFNA